MTLQQAQGIRPIGFILVDTQRTNFIANKKSNPILELTAEGLNREHVTKFRNYELVKYCLL